MRKAERIENYIKECFKENSIDYNKYFSIIEDGEIFETSLVQSNGKISEEAVAHAAEILGITEEEIHNTSDDAIAKWVEKYPYIWKIGPFRHECNKAHFGRGYSEIRLLEAIFGKEMDGSYPSKFNREDIKERLIALLKEYEKVRPGSYHEGATILNLSIISENFCVYEDIKEMTESYIFMAENAISLFIKGILNELIAEEIQEYNFLVSVLGLKDKYYPDAYLYYSSLVNCREIYKEANADNIYDYICFDRLGEFVPWRASNFVKDKELVEKFVKMFPQTIKMMREFSMRVAKIECEYNWSDDEPCTDFDDDYEDDIPGVIIPNVVFLPKTPEEINGDDKIAEQLMEYCRPVKLGGIEVKYPKPYKTEESIVRIVALKDKMRPNSFFKVLESRMGQVGGGINE